MSKSRIETLDALRGLAALAVVLRHYTTIFKVDYGLPENFVFEFKYGYLGVELFFLLSGFVIFMTIEQVNNTKEFFIKRFVRLFPTYWLSLGITTIIILFFGLEKMNFKVIDFIFNLTMVQDLLIPILHIKHIDGVYWSLAPELFFYGFVAILFYFNLLKYIKVIGFIWLLISIICIPNDISIFMLGIIFNLKWSPLFFAGILFYKLWKSLNEKSIIINHLLILFSLLCYYVLTLTKLEEEYKSNIIECIVTTFFFVIFYLTAYEKLNFLGSIKPLLFLGKISYPLYLIHQNIGYIILFYLFYTSQIHK
jgi:peptidoglycan/LPS O-acetylase OafA/YrhL